MPVPVLSREQEIVLAKLAQGELSRRRLHDYAALMYRGWQETAHGRLLIDRLEALEARKIRRLIVEMPPRAGKSVIVSRLFPSWYIGRHPEHEVILASYGDALAVGHGRAVRDQVTSADYPFPTSLRADVKAAGSWQTTDGGGLIGVGVGSGITGRGGNLIIVDDAVKDRQDAESEVVRNHTWDWWQDVLLTRLMDDGVIVVMMCMTGDTPVLLDDGTEMPLRDIRPGARVVTYDGSGLTTSTVTNWANRGADSTVRIKTRSGIVVRANGRHPFLVQRDGEVSWQRTATLKVGDAILRVTGVSGVGSSAAQTDVSSLRRLRASASRTTTRPDGRQASVHHRTTLTRTAPRDSAIGTASTLPSTSGFSPRSPVFALSVATLQRMRTQGLVREGSSASITTTRPVESVGFSATTATSLLDTESPPPSWPQPRDTSAFTVDPIVEISDGGIEDVFDIEVEGTGNYIAAGLVSHNTRWHEDDLVGRILASPGAEDWTRLRIPYIAETDDPLGRMPGTPLDVFGEVPSVEKGEISSYGFSALYQQRPTPSAGGVFKAEWFERRYTPYGLSDIIEKASAFHVVMSIDTGGKPGVGHDPSSIAVWGTDGISYYLLDSWADTAEYADVKQKIIDTWWEWRPRMAFIEDATHAAPIISDLRRGTGVNIAAVRPQGSKWVRADAISPLFQAGRVVLPQSAPWLDAWMHEHLSFPNAAHDDRVDTTSLALGELVKMLQSDPRSLSMTVRKRDERPAERIMRELREKAGRPTERERTRLGGVRG